MSETEKSKRFVTSWIDNNCQPFLDLSAAIWSYAELGLEEYISSRHHAEFLESRGFEVETGVAGLPTAFVARWGSGKPVIGINCEYDALPGLSQHPRPEKSPVIEGAPGHGCGHNILGSGSSLAAVAIKEWLAEAGLGGTVVVLGTPAEEICVGKPFMARAGLFDGLDAIIDWHPWQYNGANYDTCNAYFNIKYHFQGRTAHGNSPWDGRSALDSAVLMGHGIELLREHIPPGNEEAANTINYTFSDVGPAYPNVVPDRSTLWVIGRITTAKEMIKIIERINKCAEGASLASGTSWSMEFQTATHEKIPNKTLSSVLFRNLTAIGTPNFDAQEQDFAKKIQRDLGVEERGISTEIMDFSGGASAVSDNSEFSWFTPFAMVWTAAGPEGIGWHNWQVTASVRGSIGRKAMIVAAKVLAASAVDLFTQPGILDEAKKELAERLTGKEFLPVIPKGVDPPLNINRETMEKYRPFMEKHYEKAP